MSFDPKQDFQVLTEFDEKFPFEVIHEFNPEEPFEVVEETLKPLEGKFVEPPKEEITKQEIIEIIKSEINSIPKPKPKKIIKKIIEKQIIKEEKVDLSKYAEEKNVSALKKEIDELKDMLERVREILPMLTQGTTAKGGSGVLGLPTPSGHSGQFLTTDGNQFSWATVTASGGSGTDQIKYFGDATTDGSWRIGVSGADLLVEKRESGVWVEKSAFQP